MIGTIFPLHLPNPILTSPYSTHCSPLTDRRNLARNPRPGSQCYWLKKHQHFVIDDVDFDGTVVDVDVAVAVAVAVVDVAGIS